MTQPTVTTVHETNVVAHTDESMAQPETSEQIVARLGIPNKYLEGYGVRLVLHPNRIEVHANSTMVHLEDAQKLLHSFRKFMWQCSREVDDDDLFDEYYNYDKMGVRFACPCAGSGYVVVCLDDSCHSCFIMLCSCGFTTNMPALKKRLQEKGVRKISFVCSTCDSNGYVPFNSEVAKADRDRLHGTWNSFMGAELYDEDHLVPCPKCRMSDIAPTPVDAIVEQQKRVRIERNRQITHQRETERRKREAEAHVESLISRIKLQFRDELKRLHRCGALSYALFDEFDTDRPVTDDSFQIGNEIITYTAQEQHTTLHLAKHKCMHYSQTLNAFMYDDMDDEDDPIWLLIDGPIGTGKSHLAGAILNTYLNSIMQDRIEMLAEFDDDELLSRANPDPLFTIEYVLGTTLVDKLGKLKSKKQLMNADLLVIDDLGVAKLTPMKSSDLYDVINHRADPTSPKPTIIISNLDILGELHDIDPRLSSRAKQFSETISIVCQDYREYKAEQRKQRRKAKLRAKQAVPA